MVESYTFSALMRQVMEFEKILGEISGKMAEKFPGKKTLRELSEDSRKNVESLEKLVRETVVEMTLEPITGIDLAELTEKFGEMNDGTEPEKIIEACNSLSELYAEISSKVKQMSAETSMYLKKINRKRKRMIQQLEREIIGV